MYMCLRISLISLQSEYGVQRVSRACPKGDKIYVAAHIVKILRHLG